MGYFTCKFFNTAACEKARPCGLPAKCCLGCAKKTECEKAQKACALLRLPLHLGPFNFCSNYSEGQCLGGNYCDFPAGKEKKCCSECDLLLHCPDKEGICSVLAGKDDV